MGNRPSATNTAALMSPQIIEGDGLETPILLYWKILLPVNQSARWSRETF